MSVSQRDQIEALLFRPTTGGFVFQGPRPWVFGRRRNYLVSSAEKAELLAVMASVRRPRQTIALIVGLVIAPVAWIFAATAIIWAITSHRDPTGFDVALIALFGGVPVLLAFYLALAWGCHRRVRQLAPIVARLTPTDQRITAADMRGGMIRTTSFRALLTIILISGVGALFSAFALGMRAAHHSLASASTAVVAVNLILPLVLIAIYAKMAVRKARDLEAAAGR